MAAGPPLGLGDEQQVREAARAFTPNLARPSFQGWLTAQCGPKSALSCLAKGLLTPSSARNSMYPASAWPFDVGGFAAGLQDRVGSLPVHASCHPLPPPCVTCRGDCEAELA